MHERANCATKISDWQFIHEVQRKMLREWFRYLTALQRLALLFIFDRTLGWGKEWERITMDHCSQGIVGSDGVFYAAPFTSCRKRAAEVVHSLVELGLVRVESRKHDRAKRYALNFDWTPKPMQLPKRLKQGGENAPLMGAKTPPFLGAKTPRLREENKEGKPKEETTDASVRGRKGIEEIVLNVKVRSRKRAALRQADGRPLRQYKSGFLPSRSALIITWRELWLRFFPDIPLEPLPKTSVSILHTYWKNWVQARNEGEFYDYLEWLFDNWNALRVGTFSWMTGYPKAPALRMIVSSKLRAYYEEAYREKQAIAVWRKLEPHERRIRELVENGMDPEKAQQMVEREFATKKELAELSKARQRLSVMMETFNRREDASNAITPRKRTPLPSKTNFKKWEDK